MHIYRKEKGQPSHPIIMLANKYIPLLSIHLCTHSEYQWKKPIISFA